MIQEPKEKTEASRKRSVTLYLSVLFAVAFLLLLLAFFMQQRSSENIIGTLQSSANNAELLNEIIDENRNLQTENAELIRQVEELQAAQEEASARLSQYQTQIAELEAALAQQASDLTYEERIHLESFTVLLAQYGRLEKLLRETEYAKAQRSTPVWWSPHPTSISLCPSWLWWIWRAALSLIWSCVCRRSARSLPTWAISPRPKVSRETVQKYKNEKVKKVCWISDFSVKTRRS